MKYAIGAFVLGAVLLIGHALWSEQMHRNTFAVCRDQITGEERSVTGAKVEHYIGDVVAYDRDGRVIEVMDAGGYSSVCRFYRQRPPQ